MDRRQGFTLIEMMIVVAIVGILAAVGGSSFRAMRRNASVGATAFEVGEVLRGLKARAMSERKTFVAVLVNASGGAGDCASDDASCLRLFILHSPIDATTLDGFDAAESKWTDASIEDVRALPPGLTLDLAAAGTASPTPFAGVTQLGSDVTGDCDGRACVGIRFQSDGEVSPEQTGTPDQLAGIAFGLRSELDGAAADRRAVLVSSPTGLVKSFPY